MLDEPLGVPKGTVRATVTLILLIFAVLFMYLAIPLPEWYYGLVILSVGYYFGARTAVSK